MDRHLVGVWHDFGRIELPGSEGARMTEQTTIRRTWHCRWSQPRYRPSAAAQSIRTEALWICVRKTGLRPIVTDEECSRCPFWEPNYTRTC